MQIQPQQSSNEQRQDDVRRFAVAAEVVWCNAPDLVILSIVEVNVSEFDTLSDAKREAAIRALAPRNWEEIRDGELLVYEVDDAEWFHVPPEEDR